MPDFSVHCSYCSRALAVFGVEAAAKAHVQHLEIQAVCELCDLPVTNKYSHEQHFRTREDKERKRCFMCNSQLTPEGICPARNSPGHGGTSQLTYEVENS